ncbi:MULTISPECIES: tol-pal system protein YbgF [unclassified Desulfovibrio]|uniref:tol-pal system protein YbgF n=1 Tax=unclassified Desulfovibrio TaxID=2593640 RepID=UPI0013EAA554|nr:MULTISPECIES: tol-pal system protein YbgF [unclassified Desulfovibrio]
MKSTGAFRFLALGLGALLLGGCATQGSQNLEQRVQQHDAQLRQLQPNQADTWNQMQAMRQELNTLKGQMDDLNNAGGARALVDRVRRHDAALRQVNTTMAMNLDLGEPMSAASSAPAMAQPVMAQPATAATPADGAASQAQPPVPMGGLAAAGAAGAAGATGAAATGSYGLPADGSAGSIPAQAPSGSTWGQADPKPVAQVPQKDISLALFDAGVNAYNARKYEEAQRSFTDFLKNYKDHSQAAEAQYYLAECYFQRNQFADAALAYDKVIKQYPKSSSAPGAYLKQGISFSKIGQAAAAKARMQEVISKYPNSPEAARARSFLKTNS